MIARFRIGSILCGRIGRDRQSLGGPKPWHGLFRRSDRRRWGRVSAPRAPAKKALCIPGSKADGRSDADPQSAAVWASGVIALVARVFEQAVHAYAGRERIGGRKGDVVMHGIEWADAVGADGVLVVAAGPAEADGPGIPVVRGTQPEDELIGAVVAEVLTIFGRRADGEAGIAQLRIGIGVLRRIRIG